LTTRVEVEESRSEGGGKTAWKVSRWVLRSVEKSKGQKGKKAGGGGELERRRGLAAAVQQRRRG